MDPAQRRRLILVMGMIVAIGPMSIDMYLPSLPSLQTHFGVGEGAVQLTLSAYFVGLAIGQLVYGPVSDRIGRRGPMLFGLSLYVLSSLVCAFAPSIEVLIGARFVQAIGGCAGMIITRAIARDRFDTQEMASVLSSMVLVMGVAPILAPILGGYVLHFAGWQAIFVALAVFGVVCIVAAQRSLPESLRAPGQPLRLGLVLGNYGRLLRHRRFMGYALSGGIASAGMFAYISGAAFVFIEVFGIAADRFGYYFGANAAGLIVVSQLNPLLLRRFRAEFILRVALTTHALAAVVLLLMAATGWGGLWGVMVPLFVTISALGCSFPNTTAAAMAPFGDRAGAAAALMGTMQFTVAAFAGSAVGYLHDGSAQPMALVIAVCALSAVILLRVLVGRRGGLRLPPVRD